MPFEAFESPEERLGTSRHHGPQFGAMALALEDPDRDSGFLPLAERAERACPGDPETLRLAALSALLDGNGDKAQLYLKRYAKRYEAEPWFHLYSALALAAQNKLILARAILERHGLTELRDCAPMIPNLWRRRLWLSGRLDAIMGRERAARGRPAAARAGTGSARPGAARAAAAEGAGKSALERVVAVKETLARGGTPSPAAGGAAKAAPALARVPATSMTPTPALPPLERLEVTIPIVVETDLTPLRLAQARGPETAGGWFSLRERLARLDLAQGFDELLCLPHLNGVDPFWHQTETVRKVLKQFRGRVLLGDEVGLGKTVEAGMVLKEYLLRGMAKRALILVPASLVGQWREELETKFDIPVATTHDALAREDPDRFWAQPRIVASLALARRREHAERLLSQAFDIVIVDEAHHLRDRTSQGYRLVDGLTKRFLLLLSATPVQNNLIELYNLLTLLKPGIFKTQKEFRAAYMTPGQPRVPANAARLRDLMRDAMIRNTRAVVALKLPRRHASTRRVPPPAAEAALYQETAAMIRALAQDRGAAGGHRLTLHHLLGAAGSSPTAAAAAITRFAAGRGGHSDAWRDLAARWTTQGAGAKELALLDLLARNPDEKTLVFIQHRETMAGLAALLTRQGVAFARFDGSMSGPDKDAAIADFRTRVPVLLCSESGGEGRNIQFCNTLINFDIPWNPMAIEQRIGRIDRIGQTREVFIFNLVAQGTIEEQVLRLLDEKINLFELVVGEAGAILGELDEERNFADLVLDAWLETTAAGRDEAFDAIGRRLDAARGQYSDAKALDEALFGEDFDA